MATANSGYIEPYHIYFREFQLSRLIRDRVFNTNIQSVQFQNATVFILDNRRPTTITNNGFSDSSYRYCWYKHDDYLNQISLNGGSTLSASGISTFVSGEPLYWYWMDYGPSGQFLRQFIKSTSYPYSDFIRYPNVPNAQGIYHQAPLKTAVSTLSNEDLLVLPWSQTDNLVGQIQDSFDLMFQTPKYNAYHPSLFNESTNTPQYSGGVPIPALDKATSLKLNNLNLKPDDWIRTDKGIYDVTVYPSQSGGRPPIIDSCQQITFPYEYVKNLHSHLHVTHVVSGLKPATNNCSQTTLLHYRGPYDTYKSELYFGLLEPKEVVISGDFLSSQENVFDALYYDKWGNSKTIQLKSQLSYVATVTSNYSFGRRVNISKSSTTSSGIFPIIIPATGLPIERFTLSEDILTGTHSPYYSGNFVEAPEPFSNYYNLPQSVKFTFNSHWNIVHHSGKGICDGGFIQIIVPDDNQLLPFNNTLTIDGIEIAQSGYSTSLSGISPSNTLLPPDNTVFNPNIPNEEWCIKQITLSGVFSSPYIRGSGSCSIASKAVFRVSNTCDELLRATVVGITGIYTGGSVGIANGTFSSVTNFSCNGGIGFNQWQSLTLDFGACADTCDTTVFNFPSICQPCAGLPSGWCNAVLGQSFTVDGSINLLIQHFSVCGSGSPDCSGTVSIPINFFVPVSGVDCSEIGGPERSCPYSQTQSLSNPSPVCNSWW